MDDHSKSGIGPPKRSIDEIIENFTADLHDSDGQYIQLGFTSPTPVTPQHHWTRSYLSANNPPGYLPEHMSHPNDQPAFLNTRSNSQPTLGGLIPGRDIPDPNYINYYHGSPMGMYVLNEPNNAGMPQNLILNNYVQYRDSDFGLFMNTPVTMQSPQQTHPQAERKSALIENLVGNWSSAGSGTYSPFGTGSTLSEPISPTTTVQPPCVQSQQQQQQQQQTVQEERVIPKKRIIAEVRPMRPSYSDIVSKSPPTKTRTLSPNITKMEVKPVKITAKNSKTMGNKKAATNLKRQHSGEDAANQKVTMDNARSPSPSPMAFQRRASLDDFDDSAQGEEDEERPDSAQDSSSQSGDNSGKTTETAKQRTPRNETRGEGQQLNNHNKVPRPGAATKRPLHINNNLNPPPSSSVKNIVKGGRPCKTCGEERRGVSANAVNTSNNNKAENKVGQKVRSSSQGRDKPSQHNGNGGSGSAPTRKEKRKKKACPYSFSALYPIVHRHIMQWVAVVMHAVTWFLHLLSDVLGMSSKLSWHFCGAIYTKLKLWSGDVWGHIRATLPFPPSQHQQQQQQQQHRKSRHRGSHHALPPPQPWWIRWLPSWVPWARKKPWEPAANETPTKLEVNLPLPTTGEEAMKRLLACRGKDPYSILGVAATCTDEDIKRYYKRQAFLVHPDKNSQPGAEEAFKILVHAFDIIGEPEKRQVYDCGVARSHQAETAWSELSDLLSQLHQKMEEAANTIRCTNCGKRHRRVPVDRRCYAARACAQCRIRHAAREGDIWAESTMLGFLWHYYACMEGAVYDITEWAACQADNLRHLRANSHAVQYRIVLGKKHQSNSGSRPSQDSSRRPHDQSDEPDLEDFLNSLYGETGTGRTTARKDNDSPQRQSENARKRKGKRKK